MNEIKSYILQEFKNKRGCINVVKIKMLENKIYLDELINITKFLPENSKLKYRFNYIKEGYTEPKRCKTCGNILLNVYNTYCSNLCATQNDSYKNKISETWLNKTEADINSIQNKRKKTNLLKYGVDIVSKLPSTIEKNKQSQYKKWGDYAMRTKEIKDKRTKTCNIKYGGVGLASNIIMKKMKNTNFSFYNVEFFSQTDEWYKKCVETCIAKYGVKWVSNVDEINKKQQNGGYSWHDFETPSGKVFRLQGYEPIVVLDLYTRYDESDIIIGLQNIIDEIGFFHYFYENKNHRYYPDIYIKSENLVIEVKSVWTYNKEKDKNILKMQSVLNTDIKFKFIIL